MKSQLLLVSACFVLLTTDATSASETDLLNEKLDQYRQRLEKLEQQQPADYQTAGNTFNPAVSVILDGVYASYKNAPEDYKVSGFASGEESGLAPGGFSLGHSELIFSNNIDNLFYGKLTIALAEHDNELEVELEEAFFETLSAGGGLTIRGGRFYSAIGYLNQQHEHAWDFHDAPLIYRGLFGKNYIDDGLRMSWVAPADLYLELGVEAFSGRKYPAGGEHDGAGSLVGYVNLGGDIGVSHSWQLGVSTLSADSIEREHSTHAHAGNTEVPLFAGDSRLSGLSAVYKWAPQGNYRQQHLKIQFEYFDRSEDGSLTLLNSSPLETSALNSEQSGWYLQTVWQFTRGWRSGLRYDRLDSKNTGSDIAVLDEADLITDGHTPERASIMLEWLPSEFSRIRLQYNRDDSYAVSDDQIFLQYTFSIGAHGAHAF